MYLILVSFDWKINNNCHLLKFTFHNQTANYLLSNFETNITSNHRLYPSCVTSKHFPDFLQNEINWYKHQIIKQTTNVNGSMRKTKWTNFPGSSIYFSLKFWVSIYRWVFREVPGKSDEAPRWACERNAITRKRWGNWKRRDLLRTVEIRDASGTVENDGMSEASRYGKFVYGRVFGVSWNRRRVTGR